MYIYITALTTFRRITHVTIYIYTYQFDSFCQFLKYSAFWQYFVCTQIHVFSGWHYVACIYMAGEFKQISFTPEINNFCQEIVTISTSFLDTTALNSRAGPLILWARMTRGKFIKLAIIWTIKFILNLTSLIDTTL